MFAVFLAQGIRRVKRPATPLLEAESAPQSGDAGETDSRTEGSAQSPRGTRPTGGSEMGTGGDVPHHGSAPKTGAHAANEPATARHGETVGQPAWPQAQTRCAAARMGVLPNRDGSSS